MLSLDIISQEHIEPNELLKVLEKIANKNGFFIDKELYKEKYGIYIYMPSKDSLELYFSDKKVFENTMSDYKDNYGNLFYFVIRPKDGYNDKITIPLLKDFLAEYPDCLIVSEDIVPKGIWYQIYSKEDIDEFEDGALQKSFTTAPKNSAHVFK